MEGEPVATDQQAATSEAEQKMTVFAPRIPVTMRQDIEAIQGLTGQNVNEVGIEALTLWMEAKLVDETLGAQALTEIEAEQERLNQRRAGLANILGNRATTGSTPKQDKAGPSRSASKRDKTASGADVG